MLPLDAPVFSHRTLRARQAGSRTPLSKWHEVASDPGYDVQTFTDLHHAVHWLAYKNRRHALFFRGQFGDHGVENPRLRRTRMLATLFRPLAGESQLTPSEHTRRIRVLQHYRTQFRVHEERPNWRTLWKYREARWALLQHYEVCATPLLDITQSLMVAATFALWHPGATDRYVYALGLPYPTGSITLSTVDDILLLNLRNLMPPDARRPHFQDGYLVACSPRTTSLQGSHDLAVRMIGKFRIPARAVKTFWQNSAPQLPKHFVMPERDPVKDWVATLRAPPRALRG